MQNRKIDVICYLEGILMPNIMSIGITATVNIPTVAYITMPYFDAGEDICYGTHVAIFIKDDLDGQYKLLFHGEVSGVSSDKNAMGEALILNAVDSKNYLNILPTQQMRDINANIQPQDDDLAEYIKDCNFYGFSPKQKKDALIDIIVKDSLKPGYQKTVKLNEYMAKIFNVLENVSYPDGTNHYYYANGAKKFRIKDSILEDWVTNEYFGKYWGAIYKSCLLQNITMEIANDSGTPWDDIMMKLSLVHILCSVNPSPRYVKEDMPGAKGPTLWENVLTLNLYNYPAPLCNKAVVFKEDSMTKTMLPPQYTALKYKNVIGSTGTIIYENYYPAEDQNKHFRSAWEQVYGIRRYSGSQDFYLSKFLDLDMDYAAMKSDIDKYAKPNEKISMKIKADWTLAFCSRNSIRVTKPYIYPEYIVGFPIVIYDVSTDREYYGNLRQKTITINLSGGTSYTNIEVTNAYEKFHKGKASPPYKNPFKTYEHTMYGSKANYAPETGTVTQGTIRSMYNAMMGNRLGKKRTIGYIDVTENMYYNNTIPENSDKLNEDINRDICTYRQYMELLGMPEKLISDTPTETIYRTEIAKLTSRNAYCNKKLIKSPYNEMFIKENAEIVGLYKKVMSDYANDVKE